MVKRIYSIAVLGAGGLGRSAAAHLAYKDEFRLVATCDTGGWLYRESGIGADELEAAPIGGSVSSLDGGRGAEDAIGEVIALGDKIDGVFTALPNLPNEFIPSVVARFIESGWKGVIVDALKRTSAVKQILEMDEALAKARITYITGAGAAPGLLTAAAALASQSFVKIEEVKVYFGVGIENWDAYRATIREDIAHLEGFDVEIAERMSDGEIDAELDRRNGILELVDMEHADDVMLQAAGVVSGDRVSVGGIVDTRHAKKPVSSRVDVTGVTFEGKRSTHTFILGDETSMAANVNGPVFGYMKTGFWLRDRGIHGAFTAAELMPRFVQ